MIHLVSNSGSGLADLKRTAEIAWEFCYQNRGDVLIIAGHGSPGVIEAKNGDELLHHLLQKNINPQNFSEIYIISCDSAVSNGRQSLMQRFVAALKNKGVKNLIVRGNLGWASASLDASGKPNGITIEVNEGRQQLPFSKGTQTIKM